MGGLILFKRGSYGLAYQQGGLIGTLHTGGAFIVKSVRIKGFYF
ncbi:protein of unknown function [Xenorhabdus bovienii]|uniref:Uncharacterized protein n=1 Tax=Xenorhabdus bovienii TaxID=40576 RepID=A0A0B6X668_XENBV|nr:protein of unknown function [Xenorhabdus bovienii]